MKSCEQSDGMKYYYKLSNFDTVRGIYGHECVNEIVAQNIAAALGIPHLEYDLIFADVKIDGKNYQTWLTRSQDFKAPGEHKLAFETYYEINKKSGEEVWPFIVRHNLEPYFYEMFLLDYLICNRDRHGANIEVLEKGGAYRIAPLFDNGLSLLFSCYDDGMAMERFDRRKDGPVNNYVGSMSLTANLTIVPVNMLCAAKNADLGDDVIFKGMEHLKQHHTPAVPPQYWDCIGGMIRERRDDIAKIFD